MYVCASSCLTLVEAVAEVRDAVITHLLVGNLHRGMIDTVIPCVIGFLRLIDSTSIRIDEGTLVGLCSGFQTFGQVNHFAHHSVLEQCWITLTIDLHHLPTYRRQHQYILTRHRVGLHNHTLALKFHCSLVTVTCRMIEGEIALRQLRVLVVIYQP